MTLHLQESQQKKLDALDLEDAEAARLVFRLVEMMYLSQQSNEAASWGGVKGGRWSER